jgi:hypothetical protein
MQGATTLSETNFEFENPVQWVVHLQWQATQSRMMPMWTVYDHPSDHPESFVARQHLAGDGKSTATPYQLTTDNIETIRMVLRHAGLTPIERDPKDDAKIVETWI